MRLIPIILSLLLVGCGPTNEQIAADKATETRRKATETRRKAEDMCTEIGSTTVGFSGPSKRIEIMQRYGIRPTYGTNMNMFLNQVSEAENLREHYSNTSPRGRALSCVIQAQRCVPNARAMLSFVGSEQEDVLMKAHVAKVIKNVLACDFK